MWQSPQWKDVKDGSNAVWRSYHRYPPRDRDGSFDPQTVRKRETILAEGMADQIIGMYAFGTSTREISNYFEREFNTKLSADTISAITDRVLPEIQEWKSRMLDDVYAIC